MYVFKHTHTHHTHPPICTLTYTKTHIHIFTCTHAARAHVCKTHVTLVSRFSSHSWTKIGDRMVASMFYLPTEIM